MENQPSARLWVVRLYDGMDNQWMDVTPPVSREQADKVWGEHTKDGTEKTTYQDIDYYKVFPADTMMLYSDGHGETRRGR